MPASAPLTRTLRVSMAWKVPKSVTFGVVVIGNPLAELSEWLTVSESGMSERTTLRRLAAKVFIESMVSVVGPLGQVSI
jgi:hypothetical protein